MSSETNNDALAQRGEMLLQMRRPREAEKLLREGIGRDIEWNEGYRLLGRALIMQDRLQEAVECAEAALAKEPHSIWALMLLVIARFHQSQIDGAEHFILEVLRISPDYPLAIAYRCKVFRARKEYAEAENVIRQGLKNDPQNAELLEEKIQNLLDRKQYDDCLRSAGEALKLYPNNARFHFLLGKSESLLASDAKGDEKRIRFRNARQHLLNALRLDPTNQAYQEQLATIDIIDRVAFIGLCIFPLFFSVFVVASRLNYEIRPLWMFWPIFLACFILLFVIGMITMFYSAITFTSLPMGIFHLPPHPMPWPRRLRGWVQFALLIPVLIFLPPLIIVGALKILRMIF